MVKTETPDEKKLSIIVAIVSDTTTRALDLSILRGCLTNLQNQVDLLSNEVIVPYIPSTGDFSDIAREFPWVNFLPVRDIKSYQASKMGREHHDELRARGIMAAHGRIVALVEDYARFEENWISRIIEAHEGDFEGIGGAIENEIDRTLNWAVYFCDFGKYQNPVPAGRSHFASDANVSYKKSVLDELGPEWEGSFHETQINWYLLSKGYSLALDPGIIIYQHRNDLRLLSACNERLVWGRSFAVSRLRVVNPVKRWIYILLAPIIPMVMFFRVAKTALNKPGNSKRLLVSTPAIFLLLVFWACGELSGYVTQRT